MMLKTSLGIVLFIAAMAGGVSGQQDRGTFTGAVIDPSGAVLVDVRLTIVNVATNANYDSATNDAGQYTVPNLPIGTYRMTFVKPGFKNWVREYLTLNVAQVARVDVQMQIGVVVESVQIQEPLPVLQTGSPDVGMVLNKQDVVDLPLGFAGGRLAENFAYKLTPGVGGNSYESRINGSAAFTKAVVLDGADATIYIGGHFGESSPSLEAIEEFKVQTSGMSAEYGRTGGGIFNFVMKSGTNRIHGSAVGLIHNEWADANSFTNNFFGRPKQRDRRNDWGGSLGGPITIPKVYDGRDRTFFYVAYERYKESYAGPGSPAVTVPVDEFWNGNLSRLLTNDVIGQDILGRNIYRGAIYDPATTKIVNGRMVRDPFPGNVIPQDRISGPAQKLGVIFRKHYSPTLKGADGQVALVNNSFFPISNQGGFTQNQFSLKLDRVLATAHKLTGSFAYIDRPRLLLDQGGVWDFNDPSGGPLSRSRMQWVRTWYGRVAYDWTISSSLLSHLQLGFNRQRNPSLSTHLNENGIAALGLQGFAKNYNYPEITFGSNYLVNYPTLGYQANDFGAGQNYQAIYTLSWTKNRHWVRMGADWRRSYLRWRTNNGPAEIDFRQVQTGLDGFVQTGNALASLLLGDVSGATVPTGTPNGSRYLNFATFLQDDFQFNSRLTLNLGARWDYQPLPVEQYNRLSNWNPDLIDPQWGLPGALEFASPNHRTFAPNHHRDFSPRVGFAYQLTGQTVLRGAYGIFYLARNANGWSGVPWGQTAGFGQENRVSSDIGYASPWNWSNPYPGVMRDLPKNASLASGSPGVWGIVSYDPNAGKNGYVQQWNFNIQRELPFGIVFDIGYIGSKSTGIQANELRRLNQLDPKFLVLGDALGTVVTKQADIPASVIAAGGRYPFGSASIPIPAYQTLLPYPQMMTWNEIKSAFTPLGFSTYHALQVQANKRFSPGLSFISNYTFSKSIDNVRSAFGDTWGANSGRPVNYYNLSLDKSISDADRTHVFKIAVQYDLPFGRGHRFGANAPAAIHSVLGGWTLHYIGNYESGVPLGITGSDTPNSNLATSHGFEWNPNGQPLNVVWNSNHIDMTSINQSSPPNKYFDTSVFVDPVTVGRYQRGNTSYRLSQLRAPWELYDDFSLQKNFHPIESMRIQFRAEFLNAFNRTLWSNIETNASSPLFGQVTGASDLLSPRKIQFGIRADW
ncbi:MAG TPA: TonB-dependent receptor [Terriglobia bacterium]|nr:TonB-dependent receptor [Terriglobia bacterium]